MNRTTRRIVFTAAGAVAVVVVVAILAFTVGPLQHHSNTQSNGGTAIAKTLQAAQPTIQQILNTAEAQARSSVPASTAPTTSTTTANTPTAAASSATGTWTSAITGVTMDFGVQDMAFSINGQTITLTQNQAILSWSAGKVLIDFDAEGNTFIGTVEIDAAPTSGFIANHTVYLSVHDGTAVFTAPGQADEIRDFALVSR